MNKNCGSQLAILIVAVFVGGCSPGIVPSSTIPVTVSLTGNWEFTTLYPFGPGDQNIIYTGALTQQGTAVTGVLRTNTCFAANQDIDLSGMIDASANLTLASSNLPNNTVSISGKILATDGVIQPANYTFAITGTTPCAPLNSSLAGEQAPSFTGSYSGSITSVTGTPASFATTLAQGSANSDGRFPLSGTVTVSSATCTVAFPVNLVFAGGSFTTNLMSSSGPASTAVLTAGPVVTGSPSLLANFNMAITGCNAGTFVGSLN